MDKRLRCTGGHEVRLDLSFTDPRHTETIEKECPCLGCDGTVTFEMEGHGGWELHAVRGGTKAKYLAASERRPPLRHRDDGDR